MACGDCGDCCPPGHTPPPPHHPYHGCGGCGPPGGCGPCGPYPPPPGYCPPGCGSCYYKSWLHAQQTQHDYFHSMENYHKSMSEAYRNKAAHVRSHMCWLVVSLSPSSSFCLCHESIHFELCHFCDGEYYLGWIVILQLSTSVPTYFMIVYIMDDN